MKQHFVIKNALDSKTTTLLQDRLFSNSRTLADKKQTFDQYPVSNDWPNQQYNRGDQKHISIGLTQEIEMKENELQSTWNMIEQQVQNSTGKIYPSCGVYNKSVTPMSEHIDSMMGQADFEQQPAYTIILPLVCHARCHTVVWDVQYTGKTCKGIYEFMDIKKENRSINQIHNLECFDHNKELKKIDILFNKIEDDN